MRVDAYDAATVDENRGRAGDFQFLTICAAGFDGGCSFRATETRFERPSVESRLFGKVIHLGPGAFGRNQVLAVVDEVIHLPERFGVLLVGAAGGEGGRPGPWMQLLDRKILEDDPDLGIVRQHPPQNIMQVAAYRAFKV